MNTKKAALTVLSITLKIVIIAVVALGIFRLGSMAFSYGHSVFQEEAVDPMPGRTISVTVPDGASPLDLARLLDWKLFYIQILCSKYSKTMKPGTYTLSTAMKPRQLMAVLSGEDVEFDWGQEEES